MALGLRAGFGWPTLEALALATDEALIALLNTASADTLSLEWRVATGVVDMTLRRSGDATPLPEGERRRLAGFVSELVDDWSVDATGGIHLVVGRP
jgi:hypothetical protein